MRTRMLCAAIAGLPMLAAMPAAAQTTCTAVAAVPFTISASGYYCATKALSLAATVVTGNAITINADNVVLDLNGFTLQSLATATTITVNGVAAAAHKNVTIKNGSIRAFYRGVFVSGAGSGNLVDGMLADGNKYAGIWVEGSGSTVRNSRATNTGGTTANGANSDTFGIRTSGFGARVSNNDVAGTVGVGTGQGQAIYLDVADGGVVEGNRLANAAAGASTGIRLNAGNDILVVANDVSRMASGVVFVGTGSFRDNLTSGVTTPYTGGTDAGNNQ